MSEKTAKKATVERVAELAMKLGGKHLADYGSARSRHDFTQRQLIEARVEAHTVLAATEKTLAGDEAREMDARERQHITAIVAALRAAVAGADYKLIRAEMDALNQATMHLAELVMNHAVQAAVQGKRVDEA